MRYAICNELFQGWDHRRVVDYVAGAGYTGLEIAPYTLAEHVDEITPSRRRELRSIAEDRGITITGLHWLLVKPPGLHICHPDAAVRARTADYLRRLVDLCGDLGGAVMVFGSPNQRKIAPDLPRADAVGWARDVFASCGATAAARGVTLCLEALPEDLTNFLNTNAEVRESVAAIGHPNIRMMIDVKSMCAEAIPLPDNIRACAGVFRYVHANDSNLKGPGFGAVDYAPIASTLREVGYDDWISVEVFNYDEGPEFIATKSLEYLRRVVG